MFNNPMNQMYAYPGPGFNYAQAPAAKMTQPLTPEQQAMLRNRGGGGFNIVVSQEDMLRAICTHKHDGQFTLIDNADGSFTCSICGETFDVNATCNQAEIEGAVKTIVDILQGIKMMYLDIPDEVCKQFFQIIPLLKKVPQLYAIAIANFNKYDNANNFNSYNGNNNGFNMFSQLMSPMGAMGMGYGAQPQPQYGMNPMMQNGYAPQAQAPMYGQQPQAGFDNNPFCYGMPTQQPQMMMAPQAQIPQPQVAPQPQMQQAPVVQEGPVVNQKTFSV